MKVHEKPRIRFYHWLFWMFLLLLGLIVFYGLFAPAWLFARLVAWLTDHAPRRPRDPLADAS